MFTLTITGTTAADIATDTLALASLFTSGPAPEVVQPDANPAPAKTPRKAKDEPKIDTAKVVDDGVAAANAKAAADLEAHTARLAAAAEAATDAAIAEEAKTDTAAGEPVVYAQVMQAVFDAQARGNREAVMAVFADFGIATAKGSDEKIWPGLIAALDKVGK